MKIGTKSVLYGYHAFWLHGWFVALAWYRLHGTGRVRIGTKDEWHYGVKLSRAVFTSLWDVRLWLAFFLHDLGYWGKPNMDGAEGEEHPLWAARKMRAWFGRTWGDFCLYHSRFYAKRDKAQPSVLCIADKLAITLYPRWLFLWLVRATSEIDEYMQKSSSRNETGSKYATMQLRTEDQLSWYADMIDYVRRWVEEHKDGRTDTWTPDGAVVQT